jgi:hypothetical protein
MDWSTLPALGIIRLFFVRSSSGLDFAVELLEALLVCLLDVVLPFTTTHFDLWVDSLAPNLKEDEVCQVDWTNTLLVLLQQGLHHASIEFLGGILRFCRLIAVIC